jgi:3-oxoacyl-(acyl-carrier-protein) synthase/thioesterase domain-containing protein/acyl carrier protein
MNEEEISSAIAIIGIAGRFPGASNIEQFWQNLCDAKESISTFSLEMLEKSGINKDLANQPNYVKAKGILEEIEKFDAEFFDMSEKEASLTDPQHRLFLECAWEGLENAGYDPTQIPGSVGVFAGTGMSSYFLHNLYPRSELKESIDPYLIQIGNDKDFLATKVSYKLNLKGPSLSIQTACSTSLVAICTACNHLLTYQCDVALAGGAAVVVPQVSGYLYHEGMILSPDGHCRPFDANAQGTVMSNGVGLVVLKRLTDALKDKDHVYAVIRGYGMNNDGSRKVGYMAPSIEGQAEAISSALAMAGIDPETIGYIETHGTGTLLGDPIEIRGLLQAFGTHSIQKTCAIGSVKSNIGHTVEAAGVIGLIKTVLALHYQKIPPTLHFQESNPHIDFSKTPFYVNSELKEWEALSTSRRAGVSSFGVGGTNAHVILEEWPNEVSNIEDEACELILSARSPRALMQVAHHLGRHLSSHPEVSLIDVAYTLRERKRFKYTKKLICKNRDEAIFALLHFDPDGNAADMLNIGECIKGRRVPIPTYPFEKKRLWIDPIQRLETLPITKKSDLSIEDTLQEIWKECGVQVSGMDEDFYATGGDSLSAIQAVALIKKRLGINLGTQALLEYRTIFSLSQAIRQQMSSTSRLVLLKTGIGTPLFLIHPIEGTLFSYRSLVDYLKCTNPIYGIQAVGSEGRSIEEIAQSYIAEILKIQPQGPSYSIFGMSFGGLIAYEIARQLKEMGKSIHFLAMADIIRPDSNYLPLSEEKAMLIYLLELIEGHPIAPEEATPDRLIQSLQLESLPENERKNLQLIVKNHLQALSLYQPKPYKGNVLYFQAGNKFFKWPELSLSSTWQPLISGQIEVKEVEGYHLSMMKDPNVKIIADYLTEYMCYERK